MGAAVNRPCGGPFSRSEPQELKRTQTDSAREPRRKAPAATGSATLPGTKPLREPAGGGRGPGAVTVTPAGRVPGQSISDIQDRMPAREQAHTRPGSGA